MTKVQNDPRNPQLTSTANFRYVKINFPGPQESNINQNINNDESFKSKPEVEASTCESNAAEEAKEALMD